MLRVIIDPARSQKNLQVAQQVPNDEQHENHAGERDNHFLADGGTIKAGEVGHAEIRLAVLFSRSITISGQHVRWAHRLTACVSCREHRLSSPCAQRSFTPLLPPTEKMSAERAGQYPLLRCLRAGTCHNSQIMSTVSAELPPRSFGETMRADVWWTQPLLVFLGLGTFIVYSTWAAFQGAHYFFGNYIS